MPSSEVFASRYKVIRTVGSGGMGTVYEVEDLRLRGRICALKTLQAVEDAEAVAGFRSEFRHIQGVVHPNIPEMYDFGIVTAADGKKIRYFTCEFVHGRPLHKLCAVWTPLQLQAILVSLCRALAFIHSRGLLHRDIKPENVLGALTESGEFSVLKLVDFGLAAKDGGKDIEVSGTIEYLSPEQISGGAASVASDIYALGMLMFRLATGKFPFENGDSLASAKTRAQNEAPSPLRFRPDLPVGLADLISSLIRLNPAERPASARHVIAQLNEREGCAFPYESLETRAAYIRSAASVTNHAARTRLAELKSKLQTTTPPPVLVLGSGGLGRTRLIRDFAVELSLDAYSTRVVQNDSDLDSSEPVRVILVPDADKVTAEWLYAVMETASQAGVWCIIGATSEDPRLVSVLGTYETIELNSLDRAGVADFVSATFPDNNFSEQYIDELYSWTFGFPSALQEQFDRQLEGETIRIGLTGWELLPGAKHFTVHPVVSSRIRELFDKLSDSAKHLLELLVCSPIPLPSAAVKFLQSDPDREVNPVDELLALEWVHCEKDALRLRFRSVNHELQARAEEGLRRNSHQQLAELWSSDEFENHPRRAQMLLYHTVHAGDFGIPADLASAILNEAIRSGDYAWIRSLYNAPAVSSAPKDLRDALAESVSELEFLEGNLAGATELLRPVIESDAQDVSPASLKRTARFAMLQEKLGFTAESETLLRRCYAALPDGQSVYAAGVLGTLAWICFKRGDREEARLLAEEGLVRVPPDCIDAGHAQLLNTVATLAFYRGELDAAALAWQRCLEVNESLQDKKGIANMYNNLGVLAAQSGESLRARTLWKKCAEIAEEIQDVHRLAGIYNNLGIDSLEAGALAEADEYYLKSLSLFRKMQSPRELVATLSNLGELAFYRADYSRAMAYWNESVQLASASGDAESQVEPLVYLGRLLLKLERHEQASERLKLASKIAHETGVRKGEGQALESLAQWNARIGKPDEAGKVLAQASELLTEDIDPLAVLNLRLTECELAAEWQHSDMIASALASARKIAATKWDPFTAARTLVCGLLFAQEDFDVRERARTLRQLAIYPEFLWQFHWASARQLALKGQGKKALDEFGRGVSVLKAIASRLPEEYRQSYLAGSNIAKFRAEAVALRKQLQADAVNS